ncbi:MAG TPA: hypothetical protein VKU87_06675 [Thermomicrobiaceae bacterium]|nr:hypothetical protein [Thermomicrobiaceae bacterium]
MRRSTDVTGMGSDLDIYQGSICLFSLPQCWITVYLTEEIGNASIKANHAIDQNNHVIEQLIQVINLVG